MGKPKPFLVMGAGKTHFSCVSFALGPTTTLTTHLTPDAKQLCDTSWVSQNLRHCIPGDSVSSHRWRAQSYKTAPLIPLQMPTASPGYPVCFWLMGNKSKVPMTSFSSLINLPEWFTELRKTVSLLDDRFIIKGYDKGYRQGEVCGDGCGASMLSPGAPLSQHLPVLISPEALWTPCLGDYYGGFIIYVCPVINSISSPLSLSGG